MIKRNAGKNVKTGFGIFVAIKNIKTMRFWKVAVFSLASFLLILAILVIFAYRLNAILPEFKELLPFAEELGRVARSQDVGYVAENLAKIEQNAQNLKSMTYSIGGRFLVLFLISTFSAVVVFSFFDLLSWGCVHKKRLGLRFFLRSTFVNFALTVFSFLVACTSLILFKKLVTIFVVGFVLLLVLLFGFVFRFFFSAEERFIHSIRHSFGFIFSASLLKFGAGFSLFVFCAILFSSMIILIHHFLIVPAIMVIFLVTALAKFHISDISAKKRGGL